MKYSVGDEFPEVIFNWMDDNFDSQQVIPRLNGEDIVKTQERPKVKEYLYLYLRVS